MRLSSVKILFILIALIYFLSPWDILPDFLGLLGRLDDFIVILFLIWRYYLRVRSYKAQVEFLRSKLQSEKDHQQRGSNQGNSTRTPFDPYQVLEIEKGATKDQIRSAYKTQVSLYHPDKVAHLGEELKNLANQKILQIQRAYQQLSSE